MSATLRSQALERVRLLVAGLSQSARAVERSTGITNAQLFVLQQLESADALSVSVLAARARTRQSTASVVVARLVRAGLATNRRSADDGRLAIISLTPKGRRLLSHAPAPPTAALLHAMEELSARDVRGLAHGLGALVSALRLSPPEVTMLFEYAPTRRSAPTRPTRTIPRSIERSR